MITGLALTVSACFKGRNFCGSAQPQNIYFLRELIFVNSAKNRKTAKVSSFKVLSTSHICSGTRANIAVVSAFENSTSAESAKNISAILALVVPKL